MGWVGSYLVPTRGMVRRGHEATRRTPPEIAGSKFERFKLLGWRNEIVNLGNEKQKRFGGVVVSFVLSC